MLYIVNFDIKDLARAEQFAQQLNEVGETLLFMPRCYSWRRTKAFREWVFTIS